MDNYFAKPPNLERCVTHLVNDPTFEPRDPTQSKESAAYAVCQATLNKAMEDIEEAIVILKHFEDDTDEETAIKETVDENNRASV